MRHLKTQYLLSIEKEDKAQCEALAFMEANILYDRIIVKVPEAMGADDCDHAQLIIFIEPEKIICHTVHIYD